MTDLPHHVADTHTLIWHLEKDLLLSSSARTILEAAANTLQTVSRSAVPDMPDRIILATARYLGPPLISRDEKIREAGIVPVVW